MDLTTQRVVEPDGDPDGVWEVMSQWSTCTMMCGGGE